VLLSNEVDGYAAVNGTVEEGSDLRRRHVPRAFLKAARHECVREKLGKTSVLPLGQSWNVIGVLLDQGRKLVGKFSVFRKTCN